MAFPLQIWGIPPTLDKDFLLTTKVQTYACQWRSGKHVYLCGRRSFCDSSNNLEDCIIMNRVSMFLCVSIWMQGRQLGQSISILSKPGLFSQVALLFLAGKPSSKGLKLTQSRQNPRTLYLIWTIHYFAPWIHSAWAKYSKSREATPSLIGITHDAVGDRFGKKDIWERR